MNQLISIHGGGLSGLENLKILVISNNPKLSYISPDALVWMDVYGRKKWPDLQQV